MDTFDFEEYRDFINQRLEAESKSGARSRLAEAAHCSASWITRVLSGNVHLTPDQALGIGHYFHLNDKEMDYFLLLVEYERAASAALKNRIRAKLEELRKESRSFASTVKVDSAVSESDRMIYYSSWIYAAFHVACMVKPMTANEITELFDVRIESVVKSLSALQKMSLLVNKNGRWQATSKFVHLSADHAMASVSHMAWRTFTTHRLQQNPDEGLHYSAIHCLSKKDLEKIRKKLKDMVLECRRTIEDSSSEALAVFCLDWYSI